MNLQRVHIKNETNQLKAVVLGLANDMGPTPMAEQCYDPKSLENVLKGTFPNEPVLIEQMEGFRTVMEKHQVQVIRPKNIQGLHQVFARDIAFVIEDFLFIPNIIADRAQEIQALDDLFTQFNPKHIVKVPVGVRVEGGDVIVHGETIFVGYSEDEDFSQYKVARTNKEGVAFLENFFPSKKTVGIELKKSDTDARDGALHLDCCFQPVGTNLALISKDGFKHESDYFQLKALFGNENCFELNSKEFYDLSTNIFSISPTVVVSQNEFSRLNQWLENKGITVEAIAYHQVSKMGGLFRCSTLPLIRE